MRSAIASYWRSPWAIGLALAHAIIFLIVIFSPQPLPSGGEPCPTNLKPDEICLDMWEMYGLRLMGREFHHDRAFRLLSLLDLPALVVVSGFQIASSLTGIGLSRVFESYLFGWLMLVFGTVQWWIAGVLGTARRRSRRRSKLLSLRRGGA